MYGGLERHKLQLAIRGDRIRLRIDVDESRTATHMPSQAERRILIAAGVAERHVFRSFDTIGAYMRALNHPNLRIIMTQPPQSNGQKIAPGKICLLRRAMPGYKSTNQSWDTWRDFWLNNWGWKKEMAEPSMFFINTTNGVARMEADNDDFFVSAPTEQDLDNLAQPLKEAWQYRN